MGKRGRHAGMIGRRGKSGRHVRQARQNKQVRQASEADIEHGRQARLTSRHVAGDADMHGYDRQARAGTSGWRGRQAGMLGGRGKTSRQDRLARQNKQAC